MVTFDDAKKQVELLFGQVQGYTYVSWSGADILDFQNLYLGKNYIFVGRVNVTANNCLNVVSINLWNNKEIDFTIHAPAGQSTFGFVDVMGKDKGSNPFIDTSRCQAPNKVSAIGWKFQVNI